MLISPERRDWRSCFTLLNSLAYGHAKTFGGCNRFPSIHFAEFIFHIEVPGCHCKLLEEICVDSKLA